MKNNIGIIVSNINNFRILTEIRYFNLLYQYNSKDSVFFVITLNSNITKRFKTHLAKNLEFPYEILEIAKEKDFEKLENISCLISHVMHNDFFGGVVDKRQVFLYKIISYFTNKLQRQVFLRNGDSESIVLDYRRTCKKKLKRALKTKNWNFLTKSSSILRIREILSIPEWNYENILWFANGSKEICDWNVLSLYDKQKLEFRIEPRELLIKNTIYVSDDILFTISKNFEKYKKRYENQNFVHEKLCFIGFLNSINKRRIGVLNKIFKDSQVPIKIFGVGTEDLRLKHNQSVEIEEGFLTTDSVEYFDFLNSYLAYVFIGKGNPKSYYIGKTVYDAIIARTPVVVYQPCDSDNIIFSNPKFYFQTKEELQEIFENLKDPKIRKIWLDEQTKEIFRKLEFKKFLFSDYVQKLPAVPSEYFYKEIQN